MVNRELIIKISILVICFLAGFGCVYLYQPESKTAKIYTHALQDYRNGDFQNSYYLFSRVSFLSKLKPYAIYHQAQCAKQLDDKASEMKQYQLLLKYFKKNKLNIRAKYLAAQMLIDDNPEQAKKYFEYIIEKYPNTDYAIASEYYLGLIQLKKFKQLDVFPTSEKNNIENAFRHYLKKAPQGRLALNAVTNWLSLDKQIKPDDYLLMAKTCYLFDDNKKAKDLIAHVSLSEGWILDAKNSYALKNFARVKALIPYGLKNYTGYIEEKDIKDVVDIYINMAPSKKNAIDYLYEVSGSKGKDYIWSLKCDAAPAQYQAGCYHQLYLNFPNSTYGANAMANIFFEKIKAREYSNAEKIGKDYLNKFRNEEAAPRVTFWLGKIAERKNRYEDSVSYYKTTIMNYPDNYYAYRAYLALRHSKATLLNASIRPLPVEYPYKNISKNDVVFKLAEMEDFEVLELISDDEFIKSWIYYKKGDFSHSMLVARDAMEKIKPRPDRNDLRWRLVYPIDYYDEITKYSNNPQLMLALIREESYFNPNATSAVGARGLMQLMPATAKEIYGSEVSVEDLYKPELNIKIGNSYYAKLKSMLNNRDISAIAAYNGGIGSVRKWQTSIVFDDTDEFVEQIPYAETKNYVKKVFRSYWNYLRIYMPETN